MAQITRNDNLAFGGTTSATSVHFNSCPKGATIFVAVAVNQAISNRVTSVTDSAGNIYTRVKSIVGTGHEVELWAAYNINGSMGNTGTITITCPSGDVFYAVAANYTGLGANPKVLDKTTSSSGSGTSLAAGSATTVQDNELILGFAGQTSNRPFTAGSGYTSVNQGANGANVSVFLEELIQTSAGSQNAQATIDLSENWTMGMATFSATPTDATLDQHQDSESANFGFGQAAGTKYRGGIFIPSSTGKLSAIGFSRNKGSKGVKVYIDSSSTGTAPDHNEAGALGSFVIPNGGVISQYGVYALPTPVSLTSGTQYCFYLAPWDDSTDTYADDYQDCHGITSGSAEITNNGSWFQENLTFHYATYMSPASTTTTKTQSATARIKTLVTKTQTALARLTKTTLKTIPAVSRITHTTQKTITALSRLTAKGIKTITATSRITAITQKTRTAITRITKVTTKTQTALAHINNAIVTTTKTITALARITAISTKLQQAVTRITHISQGGIGTALLFDGVQNHVRVTNFPQNNDELTISLWLNQSGYISGKRVMAVQAAYQIDLEGAGAAAAYKLRMYQQGGASNFYTIPSANGDPLTNSDTRTHIVFTASVSGNFVKGYINGVLQFTSTYVGTPLTSGVNTLFLGRYESGQYFNGVLDDLRIWGAALSDAEVATLFNGQAIPQSGNQRVAWLLEEGSGTTTADSSGNGYTGSLIGNPLPVWVTGLLPLNATARITASTIQTITTIARITVSTLHLQIAVSRITALAVKTQTALTRITAKESKTQSALARITSKTIKISTSIARVTNHSTRTILATARLLQIVQKTIPATSRIDIQMLKAQTSTARLGKNVLRTTFALGNIRNNSRRNQTSTSKVLNVSIQQQTGTAFIITSKQLYQQNPLPDTRNQDLYNILSLPFYN